MLSLFSSSSSELIQCHFCSKKLILISSKNYSNGKSIENKLLGIGDKDDFFCCECSSLNKRDQSGELQPEQFSPSPSSPSLTRSTTPMPSTPSINPFCRECLSNQSLQIHLLASFPLDDLDQDHPSEERISIPDYRESLSERYPLLCSACQPEVERILRERDYIAKTKFLGERLNQSSRIRVDDWEGDRGKEKGRGRKRNSWNWWAMGWIWRLRGSLWWVTQGTGIAGSLALFLNTSPIAFFKPLEIIDKFNSTTMTISQIIFSPYLAFLSFLWCFWDPTWNQRRKESARGRGRRIDGDRRGRFKFLVMQFVLYLSRLFLSIIYSFIFLSDSDILPHIAISFLILFVVLLILSLPHMSIPSLQPILIRPSNFNALSSSNTPSSSSPPSPHLEGTEILVPLSSLSISSSPFRIQTISKNSELRSREKKILFPTPNSSSSIDAQSSSSSFFKWNKPKVIQEPIFGNPSFSFSNSNESTTTSYNTDPDSSMDWEPLASSFDTSDRERLEKYGQKKKKEEFVLGPQRLFITSETGIENLFFGKLNVVDNHSDSVIEGEEEGEKKRWWWNIGWLVGG